MADVPFAVTKLYVPDARAELIDREPLVRRLCAESDARLTLISAPAGAGKTTLLAQWHAASQERRPFAWLALDAADADPARFWTRVVEAVRAVHAGFAEDVLAALRSVRGHLEDVVVPLLINDAARLPGQTVLVLDDLHAIDSDEIEASLAFLIERLPPALRLVIATRVDPALALPRLRARGEVCELRGADLRLSANETAALLRERFGVELMPAQLARLQARTEGWAAAVQLAGLALRRGANPDALAEGEAGVLEYLASEVLDAQDDDMRRFLIDTSVLDRMCASLCDAVTGREDSDRRLPELRRRNLLVVALDPARRWWRYHQLFAEVLRERLDPVRASELHRRALAWHARHGTPDDAIRHALAAGEPARAVDLIATHWGEALNRGELATVERWLAGVPASDARLWLARLWLQMDRGRLAEAAVLLDEAPAPEVRDWGLLLQALHAFKLGDIGAAEDGVARALEHDPDDRFWHTVAALVRGLTGYAGGRVGAAAAFDDAARLARADGNRLGLAYALGYRALIAAEAGRTDEATACVEELAQLSADRGIAEHFVGFAGGLARAALAEREGRYELAAEELTRAAELAARGAGRTEIAQVQLALAHIQLARGRRSEADELAAQARRLLERARDPGRVAERLARRTGTPRAAGALSDSELAVLRLLATSLSNREIGEQLYVSVNTVKTHVRNIYAKLGCSSRDQAVGRAREVGVI